MGDVGDQVRGMLDALHEGTLMPGMRFSSTVTIEQMAKRGYDPASGKRVAGEVPALLEVPGALVREYTAEEIATSGGLLIQGDLRVVLRVSEVPVVNEETVIIFHGIRYRAMVVKEREIDGAIYDREVRGRR